MTECHAYRITYSTAEGKPLKYNELVVAYDEQDALALADAKYYRRPKTAVNRVVSRVISTAHTVTTGTEQSGR